MVLSNCTRHDRRLKDAASARRQQLAAQLLRGEEVMVAQQGAIRLLSERVDSEVAPPYPRASSPHPPTYTSGIRSCSRLNWKR
jgi:hypothetical protein